MSPCSFTVAGQAVDENNAATLSFIDFRFDTTWPLLLTLLPVKHSEALHIFASPIRYSSYFFPRVWWPRFLTSRFF